MSLLSSKDLRSLEYSNRSLKCSTIILRLRFCGQCLKFIILLCQLELERREAEMRAKREEEERKRLEEALRARQEEERKRLEEEELARQKQVERFHRST